MQFFIRGLFWPSIEFRDDPELIFVEKKAFEVFQNQPNPFSEKTEIPFNLPADGPVALRVFDRFGRLVQEKKADFNTGMNAFILEKRMLPPGTVLGFYQILTAENSASRQFFWGQ